MKYLLYRAATRNPRGLSDRRSSLCALLAEAHFLQRTAVLPYFELAAAHNRGRRVPLSDLSDYMSLERLRGEVRILTLAEFQRVPIASACTVSEQTAVERLVARDEQLIVREWARDDFIVRHPRLFPLAARYHGTGMSRGPGMFLPTERTQDLGDRIVAKLGSDFVGIHLRRGDKADAVPALKRHTTPSALRRVLAQHGMDKSPVYFASDEQSQAFHDELSSLLDVRRWVDFESDVPSDYREDNYLLFALEMYVIDRAKTAFRTFRDATPWYGLEVGAQRALSLTAFSMHGG